MDPTVPVAVVTAAHVLKTPVQEFLKRISGPAADEIGDWLGDKVRAFRSKNAQRTVTRAQEILLETGGEAKEIPLRTLLPLLEGASLEDDPQLSEKWAFLLASAANPTDGPTVLPSFPRILECLSPTDALMLDLLYANEQRGGTVLAADGVEIDRAWTLKDELLAALSITQDDFSLSFANLTGLGLVKTGGRAFGSTKIEFVDQREVGLTMLGTAFVRACSGTVLDSGTNKNQPAAG
jgi:hypothetical protein